MAEDRNITELLRASDMFIGLTESALAVLAERGHTRPMARGEVLFSVGDESDALFMVLEGRVVLSRFTSEGKEIALAAMEPGGVFGELSLIDGEPRSADASVVEAGTLYVLDRAAFQNALAAEPSIALSMLEVLSQRLRATNRLVESVSFLELGPRLSRLLLILAARGDRLDSGEIMLPARYTQTELAKRIAASRESVSKQIAKWTRDGVLRSQDGRLVLADVERINLWADDMDLEL
ncbi:MAG: Crp/Fnr family transcriptional regulator [Pseudomonadota bacterium]